MKKKTYNFISIPILLTIFILTFTAIYLNVHTCTSITIKEYTNILTSEDLIKINNLKGQCNELKQFVDIKDDDKSLEVSIVIGLKGWDNRRTLDDISVTQEEVKSIISKREQKCIDELKKYNVEFKP